MRQFQWHQHLCKSRMEQKNTFIHPRPGKFTKRLSEGLTRSWSTRYTSTGRCWIVSSCSHCRRAGDIPCRDRRDQRSDPRPWGSARTVALRPPAAGDSLCVSFPTARSSASCLTQRKERSAESSKTQPFHMDRVFTVSSSPPSSSVSHPSATPSGSCFFHAPAERWNQGPPRAAPSLPQSKCRLWNQPSGCMEGSQRKAASRVPGPPSPFF